MNTLSMVLAHKYSRETIEQLYGVTPSVHTVCCTQIGLFRKYSAKILIKKNVLSIYYHDDVSLSYTL